MQLTATPETSAGFIATMPSGHVGVFRRDKMDRSRRRGSGRIFELFGPSIPRVFADVPGLRRRVELRAASALKEEIFRQAQLILRGVA